MIIEEIKKANIVAMKERNMTARAIYSVVLNKIMLAEIEKRIAKGSLPDTEVTNILQKSIKELGDEKQNFEKVNNTEKVKEIEKQTEMIKVFMPKMLNEDEIYEILSNMEDRSIGNVMKKFKMEYNGKCDMSLVREVLKKF